ncbi:hypothetical protein MRX96_010172 [Rhipicephalus microplus]
MEFAEQDGDDMNFTNGGGDLPSLPAAAGGCTTTATGARLRRAATDARLTSANTYNHREGDPVPEAEQGAVRDPEDIPDPRAVNHGCLPSATVCSKEISTRPGASKIKGSQPRVKGGTNSEKHSDIYAQMQRESANLGAIVEQLRAEIADLRKSQQVSSPSPSNTVPCTEAASNTSHDEVLMDVQPGAKPTKKRVVEQPANNEDTDFKTQVKDTLNEIKKALRVVVE